MRNGNIAPTPALWALPWPCILVSILLIVLAAGMIIVLLSMITVSLFDMIDEMRNTALERDIARELAAHHRPARNDARSPPRLPAPAAPRPVAQPSAEAGGKPTGQRAQHQRGQTGKSDNKRVPTESDFVDATVDSSYAITVPHALTDAARVQIDVFELRSPGADAVQRRVLVHRTVERGPDPGATRLQMLSAVFADDLARPFWEDVDDTWWITPAFPDPTSYAAGIGKLQTDIHHLAVGAPVKDVAELAGLSEPAAGFLGQLAGKIPLPGDQSLTEIRRAIQITGIVVGTIAGLPMLTSACVKSLAHDLAAKELADSIHRGLRECFSLDTDPLRVVSDNLEMKPAEIAEFRQDLCAAETPAAAENVLHELLDTHPAKTPEGEKLLELSRPEIWRIREEVLAEEPVAEPHKDPVGKPFEDPAEELERPMWGPGGSMFGP